MATFTYAISISLNLLCHSASIVAIAAGVGALDWSQRSASRCATSMIAWSRTRSIRRNVGNPD